MLIHLAQCYSSLHTVLSAAECFYYAMEIALWFMVRVKKRLTEMKRIAVRENSTLSLDNAKLVST